MDSSFTQTGTGLSSTVSAMAVQADDKVLVGGYFNSYNGTSTAYLCRLNSDGSLDTTFTQAGTGLNSLVFGIATQADRKVLVGGAFTSYNTTTAHGLLRMTPIGTVD